MKSLILLIPSLYFVLTYLIKNSDANPFISRKRILNPYLVKYSILKKKTKVLDKQKLSERK